MAFLYSVICLRLEWTPAPSPPIQEHARYFASLMPTSGIGYYCLTETTCEITGTPEGSKSPARVEPLTKEAINGFGSMSLAEMIRMSNSNMWSFRVASTGPCGGLTSLYE